MTSTAVMTSKTFVYNILFVFIVGCKAQNSNSGCIPSVTVVQGRPSVCQGELIFNEEFNYNPTSKDQPARFRDIYNWTSEIKFINEPDYPFNFYIHSDDVGTPTLEGGELIITPMPWEFVDRDEITLHGDIDMAEACTGTTDIECKRRAFGAQIIPPVVSSKLTTKDNFAFKYGKVEVRAKLPVGNWIVPEINLEPYDNFYGSRGYESGLMRIAFVRGNPSLSKTLLAGPVLSEAEPQRSVLLKEKNKNTDWNRDYHTYSLLWKPDGILVGVDGEWYDTIEPRTNFHISEKAKSFGTPMAPLDRMFYVALGVRVGGIHDFADAPGKPWKNRSSKAVLNFFNDKESWLSTWLDPTLKVQSVKVYAL